jgi:hypothetical protein
MVLIDIRKLLQSMQKDIKMYPLPDIDDTYDASCDIPREIFEEASIEANEDDVALSDTLNEEQWAAYDEIMSSVDTEDGGLFFVDGPSGTKKTYLYSYGNSCIWCCSLNNVWWQNPPTHALRFPSPSIIGPFAPSRNRVVLPSCSEHHLSLFEMRLA